MQEYQVDFICVAYFWARISKVYLVQYHWECDPSGDRLVDLLRLIAVINCCYYTVSGGMEDDDDDYLRSDVEKYGLA